MARQLKSEMRKQLERIRDWSEAGYVDQLSETSVRNMVRTYHYLAVMGLGVDLPMKVPTSVNKLPAPDRKRSRKDRPVKKAA